MLAFFHQAYSDPSNAPARAPVIRTLGFDAPRAALLGAGFQPVRLVAPRLAATPRADAVMGHAAMGHRGKCLLEALLSWDDTPLLITAADGEQPQIFAALRELGRQGEAVPRHMHFLDWLHLPRAASMAYNDARMTQMGDWLAGLGTAPAEDAQALLAHQAHLLDALGEARRRGRISGTGALAVIGASAILHPADYNPALEELLVELVSAPEIPARRLFITGTPHEGLELYSAIEAEGWLIVGEDHAWGQSFAHGPCPPRIDVTSAKRIASAATACGADAVLHLSIGGDEAAPWQEAAIRRALPNMPFTALRCDALPDARFLSRLRGEAEPPRAPKPPRAASPKGEKRSRKSLESVASFNAYQRAWFADLRAKVAAGSPFAMANANAPQEILRALDIPFVVNQWWASIVAAKQQSGRYQSLLRDHHYPANVEAYSAQGIAAAFDDDAENAPWGGLPRPDFVHAVATSEPTARIFAEWAQVTGAAAFVYEKSNDPRMDLYGDWWARLPDHWEEALEPERIDLMTAELREVIATIEAKTGRRFDEARFRAVMDLVNEQEDYYRKTRNLIAQTVPAPIGIVDSMPATMVPQWHRGTQWARDAAKAFYEEVKARVDAGLAACPGEKVRLMWVGRGLWSEMGFYQKWEESHGAVFVWSMYLALAADGYIRDIEGKDALRALASRCITMGDELRMPTWAGPWYVHEAQIHTIDGVVALSDADPFVVRALREAGFPVLELTADNFNREGEDGAAIEAAITTFIEGAAGQRAAQR
ncbi:2-hydroxyacyl-CoA dehydratase family protein [Novosphingobium sp. KACC 22771]|uniref:2-hydroxyacyl-CoA dehydratase family protein n=1 Tax=Novosphingobium sp. KACC 22771 TaxID=3025670 RepID=UPI0023655C70|nr:2-hydroxyacyl-CoA dehydratase family protein [Novosphingobium sp. KACC 22771]WDF73976.1 2-hydroxyacyl-CoA dehydratase family protein [Novosphingobium sp. KACC 22771]